MLIGRELDQIIFAIAVKISDPVVGRRAESRKRGAIEPGPARLGDKDVAIRGHTEKVHSAVAVDVGKLDVLRNTACPSHRIAKVGRVCQRHIGEAVGENLQHVGLAVAVEVRQPVYRTQQAPGGNTRVPAGSDIVAGTSI